MLMVTDCRIYFGLSRVKSQRNSCSCGTSPRLEVTYRLGRSAAVAGTAPAGVFINVEDAWDPRTAIRAANFNGDGRADLVLPLTYGCCTKNNWSQVLVSSGGQRFEPHVCQRAAIGRVFLAASVYSSITDHYRLEW